MRGAAAALAMCCLIHAGIAGALLGWTVGSLTGALVATALAVLLVAVVRLRTRRTSTDPGRRITSADRESTR